MGKPESSVRVIVFRVGMPPTVERIRPGHKSLTDLQKIVGGLIDQVPRFLWGSAPGLSMFCNEEGVMKNLPYQWRGYPLHCVNLRGDLVIARADADGNIVSVTDADVARYVNPSSSVRISELEETLREVRHILRTEPDDAIRAINRVLGDPDATV